MLTCLRRRLAGDDGISLVEMMVALSILGVVLSASAGAFTTALTSVQQAESRTKATALANEELENLRALPWDDVGFYENDSFPGAAPADTVFLGTHRPSGARAPVPSETLPPRDGVVFDVTRSIIWVDDTRVAGARYKELTIEVAWRDRELPRRITVASLRSPSPDEQDTSDFVLSLLDVSPQVAYINADGTLDSTANATLRLTVLTSSAADFVRATYQERTTETVRSLGSSDNKNWATDVTSGRFRNGDVLFTFVATRAAPYEQEVLGTTLVRFLQPVAVAVSAQPSTVCVAEGQSTPAVDVTVRADGLVEEDSVTISWGTGENVSARYDSATDDGSVFTATIPAGSYSDSMVIQATATRLYDNATGTGNASVNVERSAVCS